MVARVAVVGILALLAVACSGTPEQAPVRTVPTGGSAVDPDAPEVTGDGLREASLTRANVRVGREIYALKCAGCHGADARQPRNDAADLSTLRWDAPADVQSVLEVLSDGRGEMPAFGNRMPRQQLYDVMAYLQALQAPEVQLEEPSAGDE